MNKRLILSVITAICFLTSCKNNTKTVEDTPSSPIAINNIDNEMMKAMDTMMAKINAITITHDFDIDYANMMIAHHQGAIDMALIEVEKGTDQKIKIMAQSIITTQTDEQAKLKEILKKAKSAQIKSKENHPELQNAMKRMMDKMKEMSLTGQTDKDFVILMIPHHQGAVEMSRSLPFHGKNRALKQLAQKISTDQTKNVKEFKNWLSANK
ncbi:DUF305 domain-containing protein [Flavobacterium sp.]|uniref:DUF305 domain-containing protein n=1 Tax=Flavobacterium sp. TaxID=239 RepID=UPI002B4B03EB|nr:DUF305 domain-containing protein [Flavobacterium sp.]HLF51925.1 DUF305 domain-containing protein [Flavobacterium sp.]